MGALQAGQPERGTIRLKGAVSVALAVDAAASLACEQGLALLAPFPLHHQRQAVDHHVQEAADQQADQAGKSRQQRQGGLQRAGLDQMTAPILKIGRYIAMTRPPTSTPSMAMIIGSSRLLMLSTALSTSAS